MRLLVVNYEFYYGSFINRTYFKYTGEVDCKEQFSKIRMDNTFLENITIPKDEFKASI